jgi:hypothetical protein
LGLKKPSDKRKRLLINLPLTLEVVSQSPSSRNVSMEAGGLARMI